MIKDNVERHPGNVCDFKYLSEIMGGKKSLINEIMEVFLKQVPEELKAINEAILGEDYGTIKKVAHTMRSSVSIMGISVLTPVLQEMENLGAGGTDIKRITKLAQELTSICAQATEEVEKQKCNYI
jgi:HPt (histidine-containing phosphotransfer) domain-containing protein